MKKAFVHRADGSLASALIPNRQASALVVGSQIVITRPIDLGYAAQIEAGETGTVDFVCPSTGLCEVLLDVWHRGLDRWDNHMWLEPYGTEDILSSVALCVVHLSMSLAAC